MKLKSKKLRRTVVSGNPAPKTATTIDPHSISELLHLLEGQLGKHIDDIRRYVSCISTKRAGEGAS